MSHNQKIQEAYTSLTRPDFIRPPSPTSGRGKSRPSTMSYRKAHSICQVSRKAHCKNWIAGRVMLAREDSNLLSKNLLICRKINAF